MIKTTETLANLATSLKAEKLASSALQVFVSMGTCGIAAGATPVLERLQQLIADEGMDNVAVISTGCMGLCHSEPSIEVLDLTTGKGFLYGNVTVENVSSILNAAAEGAADGVDSIDRTWYSPEDDADGDALQTRIVLRNTGRIDPENINDYIAREGYRALGHVLTAMTPDETIKVVKESGLRGRGGGGFPTGVKWEFAAAQESDEKYVICNADEGDPGAFMDRAVLEGDPHAVLEAMAIAGYAIGASQGVIYIRAEYPLAIKRLEIAIEQSREQGFLGNNLFGTEFSFDLYIKYGAGAFVCGEETALIQSIEGKRGMPTYKPPFPAIKGLWQKPTVVNNVETLANLPAIIRKGSEWFKNVGTAGSPGTKVFALAGKINKVGLIEVPMGTSLKDIIFNLGDGIRNGKQFKAVQTGGPSGGCITGEHLDTPIDYDTLKDLGSMMGSGGMIVLDEDDCMVSIAKYFLEFTMDESCGKCTPCRIGGRQMFSILQRITEGDGKPEDLDILRDLAEAIQTASLCGLGMTAPNPVLATLRCFEEEYRAHVVDRKCPAGKCEKLITFVIDQDLCVGCTACAKKCPVSCITGSPKESHEIAQKECIHCGACFDSCKFNAVLKQ